MPETEAGGAGGDGGAVSGGSTVYSGDIGGAGGQGGDGGVGNGIGSGGSGGLGGSGGDGGTVTDSTLVLRRHRRGGRGRWCRQSATR